MRFEWYRAQAEESVSKQCHKWQREVLMGGYVFMFSSCVGYEGMIGSGMHGRGIGGERSHAGRLFGGEVVKGGKAACESRKLQLRPGLGCRTCHRVRKEAPQTT